MKYRTNLTSETFPTFEDAAEFVAGRLGFEQNELAADLQEPDGSIAAHDTLDAMICSGGLRVLVSVPDNSTSEPDAIITCED